MKIFTHSITNCRDRINKDRFYFNENKKIFVICDGISSAKDADKAAENVINYIDNISFPTKINKKYAIDLVNNLNKIVLDMWSGTTFTFLRLENDEGVLIHTGDSECYQIKNNNIEELTIPFTLANNLVKHNRLDKNKLKTSPGLSNILMESLGQVPINPQLKRFKLIENNGFILCSDGANYCNMHDMLNLWNLENPAELICKKAKDNGSEDDITTIVIKL